MATFPHPTAYARYGKRMGQSRCLWFAIAVGAEQILPPAGFLPRHFRFGDLGANHLAPAPDFLRLVGTRGTVFDGVVIIAQVHDLAGLDGRTAAIARLLARRQGQNHQRDGDYDAFSHRSVFYRGKDRIFFATDG